MNWIQPLIAFQTPFDDELTSGDWWSEFVMGEPVGLDWLYLLGGILFFGFIMFGIYSAMLYNQVGANTHPANFRKLMVAFWLLCSIGWFGYVFSQVFGFYALLTLVGLWGVYLVVLILTRRKVSASA